MNILIITMNVGITAPGIVFEKIIKGLSEQHKVDVLTANYVPKTDLSKVNNVQKYYFTSLRNRYEKLIVSTLSINPLITFFARKASKKINYNSKYDLIFSFVASGQTLPLEIGNTIKKRMKIRHFTYFVDAIPAPVEWWMGQKSYYKGTLRYIVSRLKLIDGFFAPNRQMLEYQMNFIQNSLNVKSGVIYTPIDKLLKDTKLTKINEEIIFLYTGSIYGVRTARYLLEAFEQLLNDFPDSKLQFVGKVLPMKEIEVFRLEVQHKIELIPFTDDLSPLINNALALIDIDADIENDVFLSSKIISYLPYKKPIISETSNGSPSYDLFNKVPSIIQCTHNSEEIYQAMKLVILNKDKIDFSDRDILLQKFNINNIVKTINSYMN